MMRKTRALVLLSCLCLLDAVPMRGAVPSDVGWWSAERSTQGGQERQGRGAREEPRREEGNQPALGGALPVLPEDLETIEGRIAKIINRTRHGEAGGMVDVRLHHDTQVTLIRLAPAAYLREKDFSLRKGEELSVTGYRMTTVDGKLFVAEEVRKGKRSLRLRDSPGKPVWKRQRSS